METDILDPEQQAPNPIADDPFPILVLDVRDNVSNPPRLRDVLMQWHDDLQLIVISEGAVHVDTPLGRWDCAPGEGVFLNSRTPHRVVGDPGSVYMSFVFPAKVLGFFPGSAMYEVGVAPYVSSETQVAVHFDNSQEWHARVIDHLLRARAESLAPDESGLYRYRIAAHIVAAWSVYVSNTVPVPVDRKTKLLTERMRAFISCIEAHYADSLSIDDIAAAASVSKTECARCFKQALGTTPYAYLMTYRIGVATELMREGRLSITQIALSCGFGSSSHFSKAFKNETGMSPRAYVKSLK